MARTEASSVGDLLRHHVRRLREERGETRDELAIRARRYGLPWTRAAVAHIEDGSRAIPVEELLLLPFLFECELADLFEPVGQEDGPPISVALDLTAETRAQSSALASVLRGEWWAARSGFDTPERRGSEATRQQMRRYAKRSKAHRAVWPGSDFKGWSGAEAAAEQLAEQKAAAKLRTDPMTVAVAAFGLWGRSLTDERDRRVAERAEADISDRSRQALRGHVTRELLRELEPSIRQHAGRRRKR